MEENVQHIPDIQPEVVQSTPENQPNLQQETQVEHSTTPQESFKELRQRAEQAERQRNEVVEYARQLEQYAMQQQQSQQQYKQPVQEPDPEPVSYDDDDIIEGRHLRAEFSSIKKELQEQRRQAEEARRIAETNSVENKLRSKYNDFDSIVTYENIQKLRELKPEIAASLHQSQDLYSKAAATYTILKDLGIARTSAPYNEDHNRAQANLNKPKVSPTLAAPSALSHASDFASGNLSEDRKRQIYQTMIENSRRR